MILVSDYMTRNPKSVRHTDSLLYVCQQMEVGKFRHLPVVDNEGRIVGMLSERDLRNIHAALDVLRESIEGEHGQLPVGELMVTDVKTIAPTAELHSAAGLLNDHKIGALPVVENDQLIGIITYTDILRAFIDLQVTTA
ncbi:MAG: CBS domain-containing protein [Leptospiraceae bacterium]|nr:CBS domain-containing protein [Leptospiraceae bacterium]MCB1314624.1 CBS domain-containing protein [Leptospiraceae bacterium]